MKLHIKDRLHREPGEPVATAPIDPVEQDREDDARSLDLVQRLVASTLVVVVGASISFILAGYTAFGPVGLDPASHLGLWVMAGVTGLLTTAAVLVINRRHLYSPLLLLGLVPMAVSAYWVLA